MRRWYRASVLYNYTWTTLCWITSFLTGIWVIMGSAWLYFSESKFFTRCGLSNHLTGTFEEIVLPHEESTWRIRDSPTCSALPLVIDVSDLVGTRACWNLKCMQRLQEPSIGVSSSKKSISRFLSCAEPKNVSLPRSLREKSSRRRRLRTIAKAS